MNIKNTINFFSDLKSITSKAKEAKIYDEFILILSDIQNRGLSEDEINSINSKIESLQLNSNPKNKRRYFNKALTEFKEFLEQKFSLITEGYYAIRNGSYGILIGILFAVVFLSAANGSSNGMAIGISLGAVIGVLTGKMKDNKAKAKGLVIG